MTEQFANNASSTLNGAINNVTTTIVVTSATPFPSTGNFRLLLGVNPLTAEIVLVTDVSGTTFTVLRGQEGTSASAWPDLTTVTHILTAGAIDQIRTQWTTVGSDIFTTKSVSIDGYGTIASSHGDGYSKLYVNGEVLASKYSIGEVVATNMGFGYVSDATQSFVVPTGVTSIRVKMWGPGGGTGDYSNSGGGGPGGYTTGYLSVTPGETLYLAVGSGGKKSVSSSGNGGLGGWPGGGFGTRGDASGGGGGGLTGIFNTSLSQANALMIAGGGGGSTGFGNFGAGGGGGLIGGAGTGTSGKGGTQSAGGLNGNNTSSPAYTVGSALAGGTAFTDNTTSQGNDDGGGGSGYWGGGAGQGDGAAGGGGSGFLHATRVIGGSTTTGSNASSGNTTTLPPNTSDINYIAGIGIGAPTGTGTGNDGGDGYIVFQWGGKTIFNPDDLSFRNGTSISTDNLDISIISPNRVKQVIGSTTILDATSTGLTVTGETVTTTKFIVGSSGPTITKGTGVPSTSEVNGSVFLRTDGSSSNGIYTRQSGVWSAVGASVPGAVELSFVSDQSSTGLSVFQRVGGRSININNWPATLGGFTRTVSFFADVQKTITATSVEIQLFDVTNNVLVTGTNLTSTSLSAATVSALNLTVGSSAGNIRTDVNAQYEVQLRMNGGTLNDQVYCLNTRLLITYS